MEEQTSYTQYLADNNIFLYSMEKAEYSAGIKLCLECYPGESSYPYPYYFEKQYSPTFLKQLNQKEVAQRINTDIDRAIRGGK
ncbi:MAG: hypothetical protein IIA48_11930 [Bacteroidetes bacterium]|nr:hypothetical protein [Bacteroidota bacterium]